MHTTIIGIDIAKSVFQLHAEDRSGKVLWRKRLRREELEPFLAKQPPALIGMEACGSAHHWGRVLRALGHEVRLMHAKYVKAYVKRGKSDLRDAEAICEAVQRSNMRFVPIKSIEQQTARALERARDLLMKQRTQLTNATRGLLAELGIVASVGLRGFKTLVAKIDAGDSAIPDALLSALKPLVEHWRALHTSIDALEARIVAQAKSDERMRRLQTIPTVGPIIAHALVSAIGDPRRFASARDCAAWIGLTPLTNNSAEKTRIGHISRQGDHSLRRLLVLGAANLARRAKARPNPADPWLHGIIARRPFKVATVAQAAKTARIAWALLCSGGTYRATVPAV
ncbi:IS110 family transposase [Bradyrhizobium sp.]|uniref:IS110 family transposase n=1 Tax=Bradyrhizobium sp. TaxID=376 RepID=UPI003C64BB7D